jgi:peptide/nickel transport system substrate-binding protein
LAPGLVLAADPVDPHGVSPMMRRRTLLATSAAALAAPRVARPQAARTLKFIPQIDVPLLDPVVTSAYISRNHGFVVFDTLFGQDSAFKAQPQMVDGFTTEPDGKTWQLTLRDGLKFHDGTPVLARDCVASIARWGKRDAFGQALMAATDELSAANDKTLVFRLKRPFPLLPDALGKVAGIMCAIMPERLAKTDAYTPITEMVGSGPFRYVAAERVPGALSVYTRFEGYVPRPSGTPSRTAGPKIAYLDRIEWGAIPDPATAMAALQQGQVDWWQEPSLDLLAAVRQDADLTTDMLDPSGVASMLRFNHLHPPFNNPAIRRALLGAVNQADFMQAVAGTDRTLWKDHVGFFATLSPLANDAGVSVFKDKPDMGRVRSALAAAGYKGERAVVLVATDLPALQALGEVGTDMLKQAGINVDVVSTDWGSVIQRRASKAPIDQGGWSVFFTSFFGVDQFTPATHLGLRGNGEAGWFGWCTSPRLEQLRDAWFQAPDLAAQRALAVQIQEQAFLDVPYLPTGEYYSPTAYRKTLSGVLTGLPLMWNVRKDA